MAASRAAYLDLIRSIRMAIRYVRGDTRPHVELGARYLADRLAAAAEAVAKGKPVPGELEPVAKALGADAEKLLILLDKILEQDRDAEKLLVKAYEELLAAVNNKLTY